MKTAIILNGVSEQFSEQLDELNHFITSYMSDFFDIEAWILCSSEFDINKYQFTNQVCRIRLIELSSNYLAESCLDHLVATYQNKKPEFIIFGSGLFGAETAVRLSYRTNGTSLTNVRRCWIDQETLITEKNVYSNNLTAKFQLKNKPYCISLAKGSVSSSDSSSDDIIFASPTISKLNYSDCSDVDEKSGGEPLQIMTSNITKKEEAKQLKSEQVIVVAGRGVGSKDGVNMANLLAKKLNGTLGATRPVVMNAWTDMNLLIGASGEIVSPRICITIGASGSAAFLVGIEKSEVIISINNDEDAPIFDVSDVVVNEKYQNVLDELIKLLDQS